MRSFFLFLSWTLSVAHAQNLRVKEVLVPGPDGQRTTHWASVGMDRNQEALNEVKVIREIPEFLLEGGDGVLPQTLYRESIYPEKLLPRSLRALSEQSAAAVSKLEEFGSETEVRKLIEQGPKENRIVLTILGDGYTSGEKEKFFQDAQRITDDLFGEMTFQSYLSLFNVYAVFVPSKDSGITDGVKKNTVFGLYRNPQGSKRAIMPGNTSAIEKALSLAPAMADYPILLANDDYYGGLGGRYAISTRSVRSGSLVLRHELGHNFGNVGEEYDGGQVYQGANYSSGPQVPWKHWVLGNYQPQEKLNLHGDYVWKNLKTGMYQAEFTVPMPTKDGPYRLEILVSSVGWKTPGDVQVLLDGSPVALEGEFTDDRWFYELNQFAELEPGKHVLQFKEIVQDGDNVLAFVRIDALAAGYPLERMRWGAYRNYSQYGRAGFRPSHASCLMRDMTLKFFCAIDLENMWIRFLDRVSLVDRLQLQGDEVEVHTPALEGIKIRWWKGKEEKTLWRGLKKVKLDPSLDRGKYRVQVQFETPEVRKPTSRFIVEKEFAY